MSDLNVKTSIGCLVSNVVGGSYGPHYQKEVERYLKNNGRVWTANRLKAIWNAALHLRNGDPEKAVKLYQENSIAYHHDGTPKGVMRFAVKSFVTAQRPSVIRRWAALLRTHTGLVVEKASPSQVKKIKTSISSSGPSIPEEVLNEFSKVVDDLLRKKPGPKPGTTWRDSYSWESQFGQSLKGTSRYYSPFPLPGALKEKYYGSFVHSLLTTHAVPKAVGPRLKCLEPSALEELHELDHGEPVGKVFFVFEGGAKVRCVAQPNGWIQLAFRPLHSILSKLQRVIPESCVEDQVKGVRIALQHVKEGGDLFSLDLSSATDRLPRKLQRVLLEKLDLFDYSEALEEVATRDWSFPDGSTVSYTVGQPMGLYGSFPLLNITNCLIGRMACKRAGMRRSEDPLFVVVGDDIIFFDAEPAHQYRLIMESMGVQISPLKTFEGQVGQFAGFTFIPHRNGVTAFRPYKHPVGSDITNVVSFLHSLGSSIKRLSKKWQVIFDIYRRTASYRLLDGTPDPFWTDDQIEPSLESIDDRWIHSVTNLCGWLNPDMYGPMLDLVYKDRPDEWSYPLFHEPRMTHILGYGPDFETNRKLEVEPMRLDYDLFSDPLLRVELQNHMGDIPVKKHQRVYLNQEGEPVISNVRNHWRKRHRR